MLKYVYTNYRTEILLFIQDRNVETFASARPPDEINIVLCASKYFYETASWKFLK